MKRTRSVRCPAFCVTSWLPSVVSRVSHTSSRISFRTHVIRQCVGGGCCTTGLCAECLEITPTNLHAGESVPGRLFVAYRVSRDPYISGFSALMFAPFSALEVHTWLR